MSGDPDSEILLEINRIGGSAEVRAISASDGLEVAFVAPASASKADIQRLAKAKLAYVRSRGSGGPGKPPDSPTGSGGGRGGIVV